jgi:hypothetical protein
MGLRRRFGVLGTVFALLILLTSSGVVSASALTTTRITSVVFTGGEAHPVITVRGHGFGAEPRRDPGYHPPGHPLCPVKKPKGNLKRFGYDYGTSLFLQNSSGNPIWAAGRYRPALDELDCIGVIVTKYTSSKLVFKLGAAYPHYPGAPATYHLKNGNVYIVQVKGSRMTGHVRFR